MALLLSVFLMLWAHPGAAPAGDPLAGATFAGAPAVRTALAAAPGVAYRWPVLGAVPGVAYRWPVEPPHVVRVFDPPPQPWLAGHRGVDLAAPVSAAVRAAGAGTVVYAGGLAGRGVVSVTHPGGLRTTYEPVTSALHVGDSVAAGQLIGTLEAGHSGCPAPACLHWGLRQGERYLDPLALLGLGRVRLLPLPPALDPG